MSCSYASTVPAGVPHRLIEDDEYDGYYIPKGATVVPNVWWGDRHHIAAYDH